MNLVYNEAIVAIAEGAKLMAETLSVADTKVSSWDCLSMSFTIWQSTRFPVNYVGLQPASDCCCSSGKSRESSAAQKE